MEAKPAKRFMPENPNSLQYKVWQFVDSVPFEYFIMLLIVGNTLILMLKVIIFYLFFSLSQIRSLI